MSSRSRHFIGVALKAIWGKKHHFIGNFGVEAPVYWLFERGGTILLDKAERRLAGVSFNGPCSTWRAGHLDQVILLVWPNCKQGVYCKAFLTSSEQCQNCFVHRSRYIIICFS